MKNIIIILFSVFLLGMITQLNAQSKTMDEFTVQVDGLGCPFCAYGLEKKFKELKGIKKVKIEMETGVMDFEYPMDKQLSIDQVEKRVEKAGYTPVSVSITRASGEVETTEKDSAALDLGDYESIEILVAGNCGMCKARIENAAKKMDGTQSANWNSETQLLTVIVSKKVSKSEVATEVAKVGHDTKNIKANNLTYDDLPGCCQYERIE